MSIYSEEIDKLDKDLMEKETRIVGLEKSIEQTMIELTDANYKIAELESSAKEFDEDDMKHAMNFGNEYAHGVKNCLPTADEWLDQYRKGKQ